MASSNLCIRLLIVFLAVQLAFTQTTDELKKDKTPKKAIFEKKSELLKSSKKVLVKESSSDEAHDGAQPDLDVKLEEYEDIANETYVLKNQTKDNILADHGYFISTTITDPKQAMTNWIDLDSKAFPPHQVFTHEVLSDSHRRAASISLPFNFTFYGNNITRATIATGGFIYMGDHLHSWLAATQYIAPLMANFDTRNSSHSLIRYGYNSTVFVIQWERVKLQEKPSAEFTFQCALHINGDIVFVYKDVPIPISEIADSSHPVKIGVSDAYFINRNAIFVRRKTIYEYHKVDLLNANDTNKITNNTAIYLAAQKTCIGLKTCSECLSANLKNFQCHWCSTVKRCSDGYDRYRQEWIAHQCDSHAMGKDKSTCPAEMITPLTPTHAPDISTANTPSHNPSLPAVIDHPDKNIDLHQDKNLTQLEYNTQEQRTASTRRMRPAAAHSSIALTFFFLVAIVMGVAGWAFYAYRNPTSASGQFLIRWRPSAWRWSGGETRYTAASIHM